MIGRIYKVKVTLKRPFAGHGGEDDYSTIFRLVRAISSGQAVRYVTGAMIEASVATQNDLVELIKEKTTVEDATKEAK